MANYNLLREVINDNIFENDTQSITGDSLNSVLNNMVDALDEGYLFGGIVTPGESYVGEFFKVAFIAREEGIYPGFGDLVVNFGEIALFIYDDNWRKVTISNNMFVVRWNGTGSSIPLEKYDDIRYQIENGLPFSLKVIDGEEVRDFTRAYLQDDTIVISCITVGLGGRLDLYVYYIDPSGNMRRSTSNWSL